MSDLLFCRWYHLVVKSILLFVAISVFVVADGWGNEVANLSLVPWPKEIQLEKGEFSLKSLLVLRHSMQADSLIASTINEELKKAKLSTLLEICSVDVDDFWLLALTGSDTFSVPNLSLPAEAEGKCDPAEAYALTVTPEGIFAQGVGESGFYWAVQTVRQLIRANVNENGAIPCLTIRDWPSMKYRCFQDDITRGPSPHLESLLYETQLGAQFKHNMFTYYMEDQFEFKNHPKIGPVDGRLTQEEFKKWIAYATRCNVTILGNQQSFGHSGKVLAIPEYKHLGEAGYILSPTVEEVYTHLDSLYAEIVPLLPFEMLNVCCDETWDLAKSGPSKELADEIGVDGVYMRHILRIHELLKNRGKRMLMWGDIIVDHPDKIPMLPKDMVMMCWDYAPRDDFDFMIKPFSDSGFDFFVCPGISNWSVMLPLFNRSAINIKNLVRDGCKNGAIGMLNTAWEDDGESLHGYNWYGICWGAECSWNQSNTELEDFQRRLGPALFGVRGDDFGKAIALLSELQEAQELGPHLGGSFNARFWENDFLPQQSPVFIRKNIAKIESLVLPAIDLLEKTQEAATVNRELLDSFLLGARRIAWIASRMRDGLTIAEGIADLMTIDIADARQREKSVAALAEYESIIEVNREKLTSLKNEFIRIWNSESKPFALNRTVARYESLDSHLAQIKEKIAAIRENIGQGTSIIEIPEIDALQGKTFIRKTYPGAIRNEHLSPELPWLIADATHRLGLTVLPTITAADGQPEIPFIIPVELDLTLPEGVSDSLVGAFSFSAGDETTMPIQAQLDPGDKPGKHRLRMMVPCAGIKEYPIHLYFGGQTPATNVATVSVTDGYAGSKVVENDKIQVTIGRQGAHVFEWKLKDLDNRDITDPGTDSWHGFSDRNGQERITDYDLVTLSAGPIWVSIGAYKAGDLVKTMNFFAGKPGMEVFLSYPSGIYWDFDNPDNFAPAGDHPGQWLFSNGETGPTLPAANETVTQTRGKDTRWGAKFNDQMLLAMITPEDDSDFVVGPGGGMGGVGIEGRPRGHFVTVASPMTMFPEKNAAAVTAVLEAIKRSFQLTEQPKITLYSVQGRDFTKKNNPAKSYNPALKTSRQIP